MKQETPASCFVPPTSDKSMDLLFKTKKCIKEHELIEAGNHILVGVSGGIDSMVLTHILKQLRDDIGFLISIIHVNHGLRGKDSDGDEEFVKDFCHSQELPFYAIKWKGRGTGENLQEAARNFRYSSFAEIAQQIDADKVVLAHNQDDQSETVLLNLIRGAGLDGICGMSYKREFNEHLTLIRPLLGICRKEIEKEAKERGIIFRSDVTNDQVKYTRNFIRHNVMPLIRDVNPNASESIAHMTELLQMDEEYIQVNSDNVFNKLLIHWDDKSFTLDEVGFGKVAPSIRTRILKLIYTRLTGSVDGITRDHILKMDQIAMGSKKEGFYNLPHALIFKRGGGKLAIYKN